MADITPSRLAINDLEIGNDAPVTAATNTKIGGAINDYLNKQWRFIEWSADDTWICPPNVFTLILFGSPGGCGGGAGGNGGGSGGTEGGGGGGGAGAPVTCVPVAVVPGNTYTIEIGPGGSGGLSASQDGQGGSASRFKLGGVTLATFHAILGGGTGGAEGILGSGLGGAAGDPAISYVGFHMPGAGGRTRGSTGYARGVTSPYGGVGGAGASGGDNSAGSAGGGGGGSFGDGGQGSASNGANGVRGGGGGGGGGGNPGITHGQGGAGGDGVIQGYYWGDV